MLQVWDGGQWGLSTTPTTAARLKNNDDAAFGVLKPEKTNLTPLWIDKRKFSFFATAKKHVLIFNMSVFFNNGNTDRHTQRSGWSMLWRIVSFCGKNSLMTKSCLPITAMLMPHTFSIAATQVFLPLNKFHSRPPFRYRWTFLSDLDRFSRRGSRIVVRREWSWTQIPWDTEKRFE